MGISYDFQVVVFYGLYEDDKIQQFIMIQGWLMAWIFYWLDLFYEFKVLDLLVVNVFVVLGGFVYFIWGIMVYFNNEVEFVGVFGYEIGYVIVWYLAWQYSCQMFGQVGLIVGIIVFFKFVEFVDVVSQGLGLLFLKYGWDVEIEFDWLGVEYFMKIGYDVREMADFF